MPPDPGRDHELMKIYYNSLVRKTQERNDLKRKRKDKKKGRERKKETKKEEQDGLAEFVYFLNGAMPQYNFPSISRFLRDNCSKLSSIRDLLRDQSSGKRRKEKKPTRKKKRKKEKK